MRDDRRRGAPVAIAVSSPQALLVLAAVTIAKPSQAMSAGERP
jgi:hypothetical protein